MAEPRIGITGDGVRGVRPGSSLTLRGAASLVWQHSTSVAATARGARPFRTRDEHISASENGSAGWHPVCWCR